MSGINKESGQWNFLSSYSQTVQCLQLRRHPKLAYKGDCLAALFGGRVIFPY